VGGGLGLKIERLNAENNVVFGALSALATNATTGFVYLPTMAGTPTGNSFNYTGKLPIVWDSTNSKLYLNTTGTTWVDIAGARATTELDNLGTTLLNAQLNLNSKRIINTDWLSFSSISTPTSGLALYTDGTDVFARNASGATNLTSGSLTVSNIEINGALNHDGSTVGFYGVTPYTRQGVSQISTSANLTTCVAFLYNLQAMLHRTGLILVV